MYLEYALHKLSALQMFLRKDEFSGIKHGLIREYQVLREEMILVTCGLSLTSFCSPPHKLV